MISKPTQYQLVLIGLAILTTCKVLLKDTKLLLQIYNHLRIAVIQTSLQHHQLNLFPISSLNNCSDFLINSSILRVQTL